ncbi:MAG TPA: hypothetical protein VFC38_08980 [Stellaceae bacterium]|nr:hypothetical protein [Stellaceae bacterium]
MSLSSPFIASRLGLSSWLRANALALAALAAVLACCLPFLVVSLPAMIDYPNHLARLYVLTHYAQIPAFHEFYRPEWHAVPNIAMDAVIVPIVWLTGWSVETIDRIFTMLVVALTVPSTMLLSYAFHRRWSYWSLASILFAYNYVLLYGFTNYLAGIDLAAIFAACWILYGNRRPAVAALLFVPAALVLFFTHLYAFAVYGLMIGAWELRLLWRAPSWRLLGRQFVGFLQFIPALAVLALLSPTTGDFSWERIKASSLAMKAIAVYTVFDIGYRGLTLATFALVVAALLWGWRSGRLKLDAGGGAMLALLGLAFLVMPFTLFGCGFADYRMPIAMAPVLFAATSWRNVPRLARAALGFAFVALAILRIGTVTDDWQRGDRRYAEIRRALAPMAEGKRLLGYVAAEDATMDFARRPPIEHAPTLAVIDKHAFVPTLFAEPEKQPLVFQPAYVPLTINVDLVKLYDHPGAAGGPLSDAVLANYDYVLIFAKMPLTLDLPPDLRRIDDGAARDLAIFAVTRP